MYRAVSADDKGSSFESVFRVRLFDVLSCAAGSEVLTMEGTLLWGGEQLNQSWRIVSKF
jgi:hypothetical protein